MTVILRKSLGFYKLLEISTMEIHEDRDYELYFQKAAKFEQMGLGT